MIGLPRAKTAPNQQSMLTLQILDGGDTYYRPLDDRPVTVGRDPAADIQLREENVAGIHARVRAVGDGYQITCVDGGAITVNGREVHEAELGLGDRVELGQAVLVLGRQVKRPATANDVLATGSSRRRRQPFDNGPRKINWTYVVVLVIGLLGAIGVWAVATDEASSHISYKDREVIVLARKQGRFDKALQALARLEREWAGDQPARREDIETHRRRITATRDEFDRLHSRFMAEISQRPRSEQLRELRGLRTDQERAVREAAVILASNLTEYRLQAENLARARGESGRASAGAEVAVAKVPIRPEWLDQRLAEIRALLRDRQYLEAWDTARQALPEVPSSFAGPLRDLLADVRRDTRAEMDELVTEAHRMRSSGDVKGGVALLRRESVRFPGKGELSLLHRELESMSAELGVASPSRVAGTDRVPAGPAKSGKPVEQIPTPPDVDPEGGVGFVDTEGPITQRPVSDRDGPLDKSLVSSALAGVRAAEAAGDLDKALALLKESVASNAAAYQPRLAKYLNEEATDLTLVRDLASAVAGQGGALVGLTVALADGRRARITKVAGHQIHAAIAGESAVVSWLSLTVESAVTLAEKAAIDAKAMLGVAAIGYRNGDARGAEVFLARLLGLDTRLFPAVGQLVSRGRGEFVDEDGYALIDGKFVARRFLNVQELGQEFGRKLSRLGGQTTAERDAVLSELRASKEPGAGDAVVLAMRTKLESLIEKLARSNMPKSLEKLHSKRVELDAARKHAKDLIYDTVRYFYPYKPPKVSGAKYAEYLDVQKEVDKRVAALRKLWTDKSKIGVGPQLRSEIDVVLWLEAQLGLMGEVSDRALMSIDWVRSIPTGAAVTLRNYCLGAEERDRLVLYTKIEALNGALTDKLNPGETTLLKITNAYRVMFGHRPLAISVRLHAASRGHADEMSSLGYFSHTSPTPGRKTPFERMRLAGYDYGVSENIAMVGSAEGAHSRWLQSSGHHRNLLRASHTEFGLGNSGKHWVENFGRGEDYVHEDEFPK